MQFLKERKSEEEEEEEEYISAEERQSEGMKEYSIKSEGMESPQSLDHTYVTAYESHSLEASEVSSVASLASDVQKQRSLNSEWKGLNMRSDFQRHYTNTKGQSHSSLYTLDQLAGYLPG